jgi:ABC-type dipeptide/oligopeptide/nickel transport system permease component
MNSVPDFWIGFLLGMAFAMSLCGLALGLLPLGAI